MKFEGPGVLLGPRDAQLEGTAPALQELSPVWRLGRRTAALRSVPP